MGDMYDAHTCLSDLLHIGNQRIHTGNVPIIGGGNVPLHPLFARLHSLQIIPAVDPGAGVGDGS